MMKALRMVALAGMLSVFAWAASAQAQPPGGSGPRPTERQRLRLSPQQFFGRLAERLGLTAEEKAHVQTAFKAKVEAANGLHQALTALEEAGKASKLTDEQARAALEKFNRALQTYREKVRGIDAQLGRAVSPKVRLKLTAAGIIDNGVGGAGMVGGWRPPMERRREVRQGRQESTR